MDNSGVSWLIPILHSKRTFRFTSNIIQFSFISPHPHPTEHRGILTTPTQRFQEDFSIHLQRYSIFGHFAPFFNPSELRGILTTPTQQFRSIFGLVSPLSLRRGSISNLRSSIDVVTGIMFWKALWNSPPNPATVEQGTFFSFQHLASNPHGFSKDKKQTNKKQSNWHHLPDRPAMTSQEGATGHHPASRHRPPNPSSTVSSKYHVHQFVSIRPLAFPNHQLYNLLPFDTRPRNGGAVQPTPRGDMIRRSEEVPRAIKLTKKIPENPWR